MSNTMFVYEQYGKSVESVIESLEGKQRVSHITAPLAIYHHGEPEKALAICRQIRTLEDMTPPIRAFAKFLAINHSSSSAEKTTRVFAKFIKAAHNNEATTRVHDGVEGIQFLLSMFPTLNNKIRNAIKPIAGMTIKRIKNK